MKTTFAKGGRLDAGIPWKSKTNYFYELFQGEASSEDTFLSDRGKLSAKEGNDAVFVITAEKQSLDFQLSLVSQLSSDTKGKGKQNSFVYSSYDDDARFEKGRITFSRFIQDEHLADNPTLVIKWFDGKYMTRQQHPVLFSALVVWRTNYLLSKTKHVEENKSINDSRHNRSISEPLTPEQKARAEADYAETEGESEQGSRSLSWVQWWNRNRQKDKVFSRGVSVRERLAFKPAASASPHADIVSCYGLNSG